jgi:methyl-accepting chemotaxis protein
MAQPTAASNSRGPSLAFGALKLRTKLLSVALIAAVVTLGLGAFAQAALGTVTSESQAMVVDDARPALLLNKSALAWGRFRLHLLELTTTRNGAGTTEVESNLVSNRKTAVDALDTYLADIPNPDSQTKAEALKAAMADALSIYDAQIADAARHTTTVADASAVVAKLGKAFTPAADDVAAQYDALIAADTARIDTLLAEQSQTAAHATMVLWIAVIAGALLVALSGFWVSGVVTRPVLRVRDALLALAAGNLTHEVAVDGTDEIGEMGSALSQAQSSLREALRTIGTSSATLAGSAEELSAVSAQVAASAQETSSQSGTASAAAEEVSRNVQTVAAATEQMSASIREISQSSADAVRVAQSAAAEAQEANATVSKLGDSSRQIGDVVKVITSIAEQTNLLALNATIEAARAGEAGKGFAVVASEVKDLAQETARATGDISQRIEAIQADTDAAVAAIGRIATIIDEVNTYQTTIASAVEEQTATTSEMSRNVSEAAAGSSTIAANVESVASSAQSSNAGIGEAQRSASELAQLSSELRELVSRFQV